MTSSVQDFDTMFTRHYLALVNYCRRATPRWLGEPEDIVHNAYLRCRQAWRHAERSVHHPEAFFYRSLQWELTDRMRAHGRRRVREKNGTSRSGGTCNEISKLLWDEARIVLSPRQRDVCDMILRGSSSAEIRRRLGLTPNGLYLHVARANKNLRKFLAISSNKCPSRKKVGRPKATFQFNV